MAYELILTTGEKVGNRSEDLPLPVNILSATGVNIDVATEGTLGNIETLFDSIVHAEDTAHSSGDKGIMALGVRCDDLCVLAGTDGDYQPLVVNEHGILRTQSQQHRHIDDCGEITGWTVLGNDTINLATTTNHVLGTLALEFDKVNGAANTVFAGIQKTITSLDLDPYHKGGGFLCSSAYISSVADVDYIFIRLGTDSSNYNEWRVDEDELSAGWNCLKTGILRPATKLGNGWNSAAVTYVAIGIAFNAEINTLADIVVDHIAVNTGLQTTAEILQESTPNINLLKVGNKIVNTEAGNVGTGTQRITIATDDVNLAAIKTAAESIDSGVKNPVTTALTLTTANTQYKMPASELANRKLLVIYNVSDTTVYIGSSSVTTSTGVPIEAGGVMNIDSESDLYAVCGTASKIINLLELS